MPQDVRTRGLKPLPRARLVVTCPKTCETACPSPQSGARLGLGRRKTAVFWHSSCCCVCDDVLCCWCAAVTWCGCCGGATVRGPAGSRVRLQRGAVCCVLDARSHTQSNVHWIHTSAATAVAYSRVVSSGFTNAMLCGSSTLRTRSPARTMTSIAAVSDSVLC